MSIANHRRILQFKADGRLANIGMMFPNVEFRIPPKTSDGISFAIDPDAVPRTKINVDDALALSIDALPSSSMALRPLPAVAQTSQSRPPGRRHILASACLQSYLRHLNSWLT
ncbi:hypothetical protein HZZ13_00845 [Bradyrhizobium sp. CNPSo 4010]|uniref:Uncharacterized protein n=1 Tax=Bradyrhizobium agreste TaxID=2751811 RepID=A0ABS0PHL6_9BRAD|nr:hypothetical protein [Bradyrhizobium agreste]MBH5396364.1 hypothetical protein [Bradyrhizobium agreste]